MFQITHESALGLSDATGKPHDGIADGARRVLFSASNALPGNCAITRLLQQRKIPLHVFGSVHRSGGSAWTSAHTFFLNAAT